MKLAALCLVGLMMALVMWVIASKGAATSNTATEVEVAAIEPHNPALVEAIVAQKPVQTAIPAKEVEPSAPDDVAPSPEFLAMQKRLDEAEAMRRALLSEAIYSGMNIRYDAQATEPVAQANPAIEQAHGRLAQAQAALLPANAQSSSASEADSGALDTTLASQASKEAFLSRANETGYLAARREAPLSEFELAVGTLIPATLISAINSDTPNHIIAQVSQNVYDSARGSDILIPQGTRLFGTYDSRVAYGQRRLPVTWSRINFPDGTRLDIGNMASMDVMGMGGLTGKVNNHYWRLFGQATMLGGISGLAQAGVSDSEDSSRSEASPMG
ncbi:conjugative transfer protein TrbI [Vibrio astriarenae]|nr:conjugative transfer protein TrbI [Vibrio sp. C7]